MKKKIQRSVRIPEVEESLEQLSEDDQLFVDKSMEIAHFITEILEKKNLKQKDLALLMGKSEAEISKLLSGMHNFTLRSIAKMEAALQERIVCTPSQSRLSISYTERFQSPEIISMQPTLVASSPIHYNTCKIVKMETKVSQQIDQKAI